MSDQVDVRSLPIDITFPRLLEWLVGRRKIPVDWRKQLTSLRARISSAFSSLNKELDSLFLTLDPDWQSTIQINICGKPSSLLHEESSNVKILSSEMKEAIHYSAATKFLHHFQKMFPCAIYCHGNRSLVGVNKISYLIPGVPCYLQKEEKEEAVWAAGLSCLLYFVCDNGIIQRKRLKGIDGRDIACGLK